VLHHLATVEIPRSDRRPAPHTLLAAAGLAALVTGLCFVTVDQPLARWLAQFEPHPIWDRVVAILEWTVGLPIWKLLSAVVVVAGMLAAVIVPRWRVHAPAWMFVAGTHLASRLAMIYMKDFTGRLRPTEWLEKGGDDTFWRGGASFPSGHVSLFASLAIPIAVLWPRTRPVLAVIAVVSAARIAVNAHFISDATGSVALVALVAWGAAYLARPLRR
jgi:membrane-associated phospholipid phosphatase